MRQDGLSRRRVRQIRRALRVLHNWETLAANVYRFQIRTHRCEHNRALIAAMCNEMMHQQDYLVKLYEFGGRPSSRRCFWWLAGAIIGAGSRLLGRTVILKAGIRIEKHSVRRYEALLQSVKWDAETRCTLEKNIADEYAHIRRWKDLLRTAEPDY